MRTEVIPICWERTHREFRARVDHVTGTDWRITVTIATVGGRKVVLYEATRQFRHDQGAKSFADNMLRRLTKHRCDFGTCGEWLASPSSERPAALRH
jgi:hypothetical protein